MAVFDVIRETGHEQVVYCHEPEVGLRAIIAIHDTTLGPALGGCRMLPYSSEDEALADALRLSQAMTYKTAAAGLNHGGGKTVVIGDPATDKSEALFRTLGRFVQSLHGRYIIGEDVGLNTDDIAQIALETEHAVGLADTSGDPAEATAYGVYKGIEACLQVVHGTSELNGRTIAIQGLGNVGFALAKRLHAAGARLIVTDVSSAKVAAATAAFAARAVAPEAIYDVGCDVFSPCALGGVVNDETIKRLRAKIIAGSANNQLMRPEHGAMLADKNILYAPDYVINAGGAINVSEEYNPLGYERERAYAKVARIYDSLLQVFEISRTEGIATAMAANMMAERRLRQVAGMKSMHLGIN